jgi:phosphoglucosamine mutase
MSRKFFGTDGVRGRVGQAPITPAWVLALGFAAGRVLASQSGSTGGVRPTVLIGKDTRISGYMLESALEAGFSAAGVDVLLVGPMPTPGVAFLPRAMRLCAGVMISASHNPFDDNGIKFFSGDGMKLPDATEAAMEAAIESALADGIACKSSAELGKVRRIDDAQGRYLEFCKSSFPNSLNLRGLKLVLDCANGAAYDIAPKLFWELGAEVTSIGVSPNGMNINDGVGATHTAAVVAKVREVGADLGIALDGDGDRLMMCDATGRVFDGDELLYAVVKDRHQTGTLRGGVAGTLMTNFGFEMRLADLGIPFTRTKVGDRYVLEALLERGWDCGGENSGHIICLDRHTTGDGTISALQVLAALARNQSSLADFTRDLVLFPQKLVNVRTAVKFDFANSTSVQASVAAAEAALAGKGRVLLRASGTEPLIRVMVEGEDAAMVAELADSIANCVRAETAG